MKCQYCNHNEAEHNFRVLMMGEVHEVHLCSECTHKFQQYYESMQQQPAYAGAGRHTTNDNYPSDAGDDIKVRRRLNGLRTRLKEAIELEKYEEAARLRDEIALEEKEVYACES